jgi:short-subunit dehydrogenase
MVVVITGASSGIGKATAIAFAARGADVVLAARRREALEDAAEECRRHGVDALAVPTDTADAGDVDRLAARAIERFGTFDVWVNNAGVLVLGSLSQTPAAAYQRALDVNVVGYVNGARAALRHFHQRGRGVLINNASLFSVVPAGYSNAYTATKQAVVGLTDALREELAREKHIHAVKILPAGVDTPILEHAANYTGRRIRPAYPLVPAERVADVIVRCAERPRRAAFVGVVGRAQATLYRLAPGASEWLYGQLAHRALARADLRASTDGSLFEPVRGGTATGGDLRARSHGPRVAAAGVLALGTAAALLGAKRRRTAA